MSQCQWHWRLSSVVLHYHWEILTNVRLFIKTLKNHSDLGIRCPLQDNIHDLLENSNTFKQSTLYQSLVPEETFIASGLNPILNALKRMMQQPWHWIMQTFAFRHLHTSAIRSGTRADRPKSIQTFWMAILVHPGSG